MTRRHAFASILLVVSTAAAAAQQPHPNKANWALADRFTNDALQPMIYTSNLPARFIGKSDSIYYNYKDRNGSRFNLVVPATRAKQPLFDHRALAAALTATGRPYDFNSLPFTTVRFTEDHKRIVFLVDSTRFEWDLRANKLSAPQRLTRAELTKERQLQNEGLQGGRGGGGGGGGRQGGFGGANADFRAFSPDSTAYVYAMNHNLYIVETKGDSTPVKISSDGVTNYSFGFRDTAPNQCVTQGPGDDQQQDDQQQEQQQAQSREPRVRAQVTWSPDSKSFAVTRNDSRNVKDLYLVNVLAEPRPTLCAYRYSMPGEDSVPQQELNVFKRGDKQITKLDIGKWQDQRLFDIHFPVNGDKVRLVRRDRLQRNEELVEIDLATKQSKTLLTELTENANLERQNVRYVKAGGDFLWWSERSGWGHYYLYDFNGNFKNSVTAGDWRAESIADLDSVGRILYFRAVGREDGEVPYYTHTYRVGLDGAGLTILDPGDATHTSTLSPSKRYLIDNASRVDLPTKTILRDALGKEVMPLEEMDVSRLKEYGWRPPERFVVKAADGVTNIYGNIFKPFDFDSTKKYPIVANVYPGPQTEQVTYNFAPTGVQQRLAQLGIIVIQIGNRGGSPQRSNAYQHYGYYNLRDYGLADKKAGIEQLAARHSYIDIDRVGIFGHSGGGFMTAAALLEPPYNEFFKVGVSSSGNHDNNVYNQNWSEQYHGLKEIRVPKNANLIAANGRGRGGRGAQQGAGAQQGDSGNGTMMKASTDAADSANMVTKFSIHVPTNADIAPNLKGRLLLVHGDMDNNVHPAGTIRLMNALIRANKRFDFMLMPGKPHGYGDMQPYFTRLMMEYFAEHLIGDYYRTDADMKGK